MIGYVIGEWQVAWLEGSRRTATSLADFFAPEAPPNRLDILRGRAGKPR